MVSWIILTGLVFNVVPILGAEAATVRQGQSVTITEPIEGDIWTSGRAIEVKAPIGGEIIALGQNVTLARPPRRSALVVGENVTIDEGVGYNLFAAGNTITIKGKIDHDAYLAASSVIIDPATEIKGTLFVGGGVVKLGGKIGGDVRFKADTLTSSAAIGGDLKGESPAVTFTGGSLGGDFLYRARAEASGLDKVKIGGKTERTDITRESWQARQRTFLTGVLMTLVVGAALVLFTPKKVSEVTEAVRLRWRSSFVFGLIVLVATPPVLLLIMSTLIGLPLAVIGLALYGVSLYLASVVGQVVVGEYLMRRASRNFAPWRALLIGTVVIWVVTTLPAIGPFMAAAFFVGVVLPTFGATLALWKQRLSE